MNFEASKKQGCNKHYLYYFVISSTCIRSNLQLCQQLATAVCHIVFWLTAKDIADLFMATRKTYSMVSKFHVKFNRNGASTTAWPIARLLFKHSACNTYFSDNYRISCFCSLYVSGLIFEGWRQISTSSCFSLVQCQLSSLLLEQKMGEGAMCTSNHIIMWFLIHALSSWAKILVHSIHSLPTHITGQTPWLSRLVFVSRLVLLRRQLGGQTVLLIIGDRDTAGQRDLGMLAWQWGKVITTTLSASSLWHSDEKAVENNKQSGAHTHILFVFFVIFLRMTLSERKWI